jgi:predicted MFS family arabinose efflux permease
MGSAVNNHVRQRSGEMTNPIAGVSSDRPAERGFSRKYRSQVLALLTLGFTLNFMDRMIMAAIGIPIREDMHLTSTQLGLLNGLYFALTYVVLGLPVARIADRVNRVGVIGLALLIWSGFTALCGMAASFASLAFFRFGVGVGEAGFSAPSQSLISDMYEPSKRASALSIFTLGVPLGGIFGAVLGGYVADWFGWRAAFYLLGLPGMLLAVGTWLFVKEPQRGAADGPVAAPGQREAVKPKLSLLGELKELRSISRALFLQWPMVNILAGMTLVSFSGYGIYSFVSQYVYARFGLSLGESDLVVGLVMAPAAAVGTLAGGFIVDHMARRSLAWHVLVPAIGLILCVALYAVAYTRSDWRIMFSILAVPAALHYLYMAPSFALAQNAVPAYQRATMAALVLFVVNFIALGGGPTFTGALVDYYANLIYVHPTVQSFWPSLGGALLYALREMVMAYVDLFTFTSHATASSATQVFAAACPGGIAPVHAGVVAVQACNRALSWGSQQAILVGLGAYVWGAVHYALATFGLAKMLARQNTPAADHASGR